MPTAAQHRRVTAVSDGVHPSADELIGLRLVARDLPLLQRQASSRVLACGHRSAFRGRGMDYLESRGYQPGDDIRTMDWRVTARAGHPHTKVYQEERERPVVVMVDVGPGMFFATRGAFKSIIAARAAALIAWATVLNGDRIGALLYNGRHREIRPTGGPRGALRLIRDLVQATDPTSAAGHVPDASAFSRALVRLRRIARPGSLIVLVSDFYTLPADSRQHLQRLRAHNDVLACQILDPLEREAPPPGHYPVRYGQQTGQLDTRSAARRQAWTAHFAERRQVVETLMQQTAIPLLRLTTTDDVSRALRQALQTAATATREHAA